MYYLEIGRGKRYQAQALTRDTGRPRLMSSSGAREQPGAAGQGRQSADALRASARAARRFFFLFLCSLLWIDLRLETTKKLGPKPTLPTEKETNTRSATTILTDLIGNLRGEEPAESNLI
jgi:hypothetical protein